MNDIIVRSEDLPCGTNGVTVVDENGDYNVYINAKLSETEQQRTYRHEVQHIIKNHFYSDKEVKVMEEEAEFFCG